MAAKRNTAYEDRSVTATDEFVAASAYDHKELELQAFDVDTSHARISVCQTAQKGVPLLFLHGNSGSKAIFVRQFRSPLGRNFRLIGLDLPGHGASSPAHLPNATYSISGYADAVIEVLEALDIDQVILIGWSLGGHVALEVSACFPGVVGSMIVGAPPIRVGFRGILQGFRFHPLAPLLSVCSLSDAQIRELAMAMVGSEFAPQAEESLRSTHGQARELMFRSLLYGDHADPRDLIETSKAPIAIVAGANDPFVDTRYLRRLKYASLWSGVCHLVRGAGHAPFLDAHRDFNALLSSFAIDMSERASALRAAPQLVYSG